VGENILCVHVWRVLLSPHTILYLGAVLSVWKVFLTLISKSAEIYLSMVGAKQHNDTSLSWFRLWAVRPPGVRSGRCITFHRGACRGELQARREKRGSLQVLEV
jgi:hypothetical protein